MDAIVEIVARMNHREWVQVVDERFERMEEAQLGSPEVRPDPSQQRERKRAGSQGGSEAADYTDKRLNCPSHLQMYRKYP